MVEIGFNLEVVVDIPDSIYNKYVDEEDGLCNLYELIGNTLDLTTNDSEVKIDFINICYPEKL